MAKKGNGKLKIIYVLDILKHYSDEEHPINAGFIAEKLLDYGIEAERKSIYSDIAYLEEYGCDIIKTTDKKGGWFIGDRDFEVPEIFLLCDAVRSAKFISVKKTREILAKLHKMLSISQVKSRGNSVYFSVDGKCTNEELYYNIDSINKAIATKKKIKLVYSVREFDDNREILQKEKHMTVNPYALSWQDDHYYLVGNHVKYDNLLHLRVDRISKVEVLSEEARPFSEVSEYSEFFDIADYTNKLFMMHGGELCDIELRCNKKITEHVLDRFSQKIFIKNVTEDEFSFTVKAAISEALVTWIINYGENLIVSKPEILKNMVKERAQKVLSNYSEDKQL